MLEDISGSSEFKEEYEALKKKKEEVRGGESLKTSQ